MAKLQLCYWLFLFSFALYAKVVLSYQHQSFGIRNHGLLTSGKGFFPTYHKCFGQLCRLAKNILGYLNEVCLVELSILTVFEALLGVVLGVVSETVLGTILGVVLGAVLGAIFGRFLGDWVWICFATFDTFQSCLNLASFKLEEP